MFSRIKEQLRAINISCLQQDASDISLTTPQLQLKSTSTPSSMGRAPFWFMINRVDGERVKTPPTRSEHCGLIDLSTGPSPNTS